MYYCGCVCSALSTSSIVMWGNVPAAISLLDRRGVNVCVFCFVLFARLIHTLELLLSPIMFESIPYCLSIF